MSTRDEAIEALAEIFAGPFVIHQSVLLEHGGIHREMAQRFFDARDKLGITGYMQKDEAVRVLKQKFEAI